MFRESLTLLVLDPDTTILRLLAGELQPTIQPWSGPIPLFSIHYVSRDGRWGVEEPPVV